MAPPIEAAVRRESRLVWESGVKGDAQPQPQVGVVSKPPHPGKGPASVSGSGRKPGLAAARRPPIAHTSSQVTSAITASRAPAIGSSNEA